jgi:hypothetical protein
MDKHDLCRGRLKLLRIQAKFNNIELPYICSSKIAQDEYAVFGNEEKYEYREYSACCAFDARANLIDEILIYNTKHGRKRI